MFEDKMQMQTGISGRDLQRAIRKYGIYDRKIKQAKLKEKEEEAKITAMFKQY